MNRREFIERSVLAGAAMTAAPRVLRARTGASDRLRLGFIGCGARGQELLQIAHAAPGVEVVSLVDAYSGRAERARARTGGRAAIAPDYRAVLDRDDVDAVFISTPDHWHRAMVVDAVTAGKDVYVEKPMTFAVDEGLDIVAAVRKSGRILQVGSQGVSGVHLAKARNLVRDGRLGQVTMVRAAYNRNSASGAWLYPIPPDASPTTVNWDQFLGPAPRRPFSLERFFRWRCYWDYSGGIATDLFVHLVSWLHTVLDAKMPATVLASGEVYRWKDTHEVPDTVNALLSYPEGFMASLSCTFNNEQGSSSGLEILGTKGSLLIRGDRVEFRPEPAREDNRWVVASWPEPLERAYYDDPKVRAIESPDTWPARMREASEVWTGEGRNDTVQHVQRFFECVRTRQTPVEDAVFGHHAASCAHMVNRAIKERRLVEWDFTADRIRTT